MKALERPTVLILATTFVVLVAVAATFVLLSLVFFRGFRAEPRFVYDKFFATPRADVQRLGGGGSSWLGTDAYVRFVSPTRVQLKDESQFEEARLELHAVRYFSFRYPFRRSELNDTENILFLKMKREGNKRRGAYLIWNRRTGAHYFHFWGGS